MHIKKWDDRSCEIANLLNPAFCSVMAREIVRGYEKESGKGMPYLLLFISMPIVLHKSTRELLPKTISTKLHAWLQKNQDARIGYSDRTKNLVPYVKESLMFGLHHGLVQFTEDGELVVPKKKMKKIKWNRLSEPYACEKASYFIGRWMAGGGKVTTIYAMWGVRP